MSNLDNAYLMVLDLLAADLENYLDRLFDENTSQLIDDIPPELSALCLGGLAIYALAFGYRVGRNYKR